MKDEEDVINILNDDALESVKDAGFPNPIEEETPPIWERLPDRVVMMGGFKVKLCRLLQCEKVIYARGLCQPHYVYMRAGKLNPETGLVNYQRQVKNAVSQIAELDKITEVNNLGPIKDWVYISNTQELLRRKDLFALRIQAVDIVAGPVVRALIKNNKIEVCLGRKFEVYNPSALEKKEMETGEVVKPPVTENMFNTFRPERIMWAKNPNGNLPEPIKILLKTLAPVESDQHYLEQWLAFITRNPGAVGCSLILRGVHGSGKSTLALLIETIFGPYTSTIRVSDIENSFNSWMEDKLVIFCEEMSSGGTREQIRTMNELKKYISGGTITINRKGVPQYPYICSARWMMFSNAKTPIIMEPTERRYSVIESSSKIPEAVGKQIYEHKERYAQELLDYLHTVDISEFTAWTQLQNDALEKIKRDSEVYFI